MIDQFPRCLPVILACEGGYVNDLQDPGGATNHGITQRTLSGWRGHPVSAADVRALSLAEAGAIYRARYWEPMGCGSLPPGLGLMVFDFGVNGGPGRATRMLQACVGAVQDGEIGPATLGAVARMRVPDLIENYADARRRYYRGLPTFPHFGKGWFARVAGVEHQALQMARMAQT